MSPNVANYAECPQMSNHPGPDDVFTVDALDDVPDAGRSRNGEFAKGPACCGQGGMGLVDGIGRRAHRDLTVSGVPFGNAVAVKVGTGYAPRLLPSLMTFWRFVKSAARESTRAGKEHRRVSTCLAGKSSGCHAPGSEGSSPPLEVFGNTLRDVLEGYCEQNRRGRSYILGEQGCLRPRLALFVDGVITADRIGLGTRSTHTQ
jgi:hypothetical protein